MRNSLARYFAHALFACGSAFLGLQAPAQAQTLAASSLPEVVSGAARKDTSFTIQVANSGPNEAFGVVVKFSVPKGAKLGYPGGNCSVLSKNGASVQCVVGYIAPGSSADLDLTISANKAGDYSMAFSVVCTAEACNANPLPVPILFN
jgi:hypothetical protein